MERLTLGFVTARPAAQRKGDSRWYVNSGVGRLVDALKDRVSSLVFSAPLVESEAAHFDHLLDLPSEQCFAMPPLGSFIKGFPKALPCGKAIYEVERRCQATLVQLPFAAPLALLAPRRPRVYQVCSDQKSMVRSGAAYQGWSRRVAAFTADSGDLLHQGLFRLPHTRVVTHGTELLERYGPQRGRSVVSTSLLRKEIMSVSRKRKEDGIFRILFVGFLRPGKGIDVLVESLKMLLARNIQSELCIVGGEDNQEGFAAQMLESMRPLMAQQRIRFLGPQAFGPDLFQCYADADVLALPSRSEGTPRVLVEARAFGCPVVATEVGGIPASVTHGKDGLLVPRDDPAALTDALAKIASDSDCRRRLVANGLERARHSTVEDFADTLLSEVYLAIS